MTVSVWLVLLIVSGSLAGVVVVPEEKLGDEKACVQQDVETECAGEEATEWKIVWCRMVKEAKRQVKKKPKFEEILRLMNNDGAFTDLLDDYGKEYDKSRALMTHGQRLATLLLHHIDISKEEAPLDKIELGFSYIIRDDLKNKDSNRWGHVMGTPLKMYPSAVLAKCVVADDFLEKYLNKYWRDTPGGPAWDPTDPTGYMSGGNLGTRALVGEVEGMVRGGQFMKDRHTSVASELYNDLALMNPRNGNGLRPDGCLHQHNMLPLEGYLDHRLYLIYNGSYGMEMLLKVSQLFKWFRGLAIQYDKETIDKLFMAFFDCHQWLFRGKTFEPTSCGRFITNGKKVTRWAAKAGVDRVAVKLQSLGMHKEELDKVRLRYSNPIPGEDFALVGHRYFFNSDLSVHHRVGYMASVKVLSNRTCRPETYSAENKDGYFQADGWLTVLVDAGEYGNGSLGTEIFKKYDWALVPGVTNIHMSQVLQMVNGETRAKHFYNNAGFVGGVTDGLVGLTTMDYNRIPVSVTALKSYFFFDDVVVALGSRVTRIADNYKGDHVVTTLAQMEFDSENGATLGTSGGGTEEVWLGEDLRNQHQPKYLHHRKIGYIFLTGNELVQMKAVKHDNCKIFTAVLDHGEMPNDVSLAYAVYPGKTLEETKTLATDPGVQVLFNDPDLHVVCHKESKTVGMVLASAGQSVTVPSCGTAGGFTLTVDQPILALVKVTETQIIVTVADPTQTLTQVTFTLTFNGVDYKRVVTLPVDQHKGKSKVTTIST